MEPFLTELRGEVADTKRVRSAMRSEVSYAQAAFVGVLEKSALIMGSAIRPSASRNGVRIRMTPTRARSETFPDAQNRPAPHSPADDDESDRDSPPQREGPHEPEDKHVTFEDMGSIIAKVKRARGIA
jgi:hypothetical protein